MEPSRKRLASELEDDEDTCFVCTVEKKYGKAQKYKKVPTVEVRDVASVKEQYDRWLRKTEWPDNIAPAFSYLQHAFSEGDCPNLRWHYSQCRPNFMSQNYLNRYPDKEIDISDTEPEDMQTQDSSYFLRSNKTKEYNKDLHCVVCCTGRENGTLHKVLSFNRHGELETLSLSDQELMIRLAHAYDGIAGDILYHSLCLTNHLGYSNTADSSSHSSHATDIATVYSILKRELMSLVILVMQY